MKKHYTRRRLVQVGLSVFGWALVRPGLGWAQTKAAQGQSKQTLTGLQQKFALALQHEHGAMVQYTNHAGKLAAKQFKEHAGTIQAIVGEEQAHAQCLVQLLYESGAEPTVAVWPPQTAAAVPEMMRQDIAAEKGAISLYEEILNQENMSANMRRSVEWMLEQEIQHENMFTRIQRFLATES
mgnify:CR=1 FL=1